MINRIGLWAAGAALAALAVASPNAASAQDAARLSALQAEIEALRKENAALRARARLGSKNAAPRERGVRPEVSGQSGPAPLPPTAALAADMPVKAPPAVISVYNWTGLYVGGVIGGGIVTPYYADFDGVHAYHMRAGDWAFTGGGTVGYNWQFGRAVLGVEADFNWSNFQQRITNNPYTSRFDAKWDWFSTVRARAGLALDRTLIYTTGGLALVNLNYQVANPPPSGCGPTAANDCAKLRRTEIGLVAGAGLEHAWTNNWSVKAEYLFIYLPTRNLFDAFDPNPRNQYQFTTYAQFARLGLNYKWNEGTAVANTAFASGLLPAYSPVSTYSWSGLYVGGVIGGGIVTPEYADFNGNHAFYLAAADWAATAGATAGYNWQVGRTVFGIEADVNWTNYKRSTVVSLTDGRFDAKWNSFTTVRARAGLAADRTLIYATGGVAFVNLDYRTYDEDEGCGPAANNRCAKLRKTEVGLAAGAGLEHAWDNHWSVKAEYLLIHLPTRTINDAFDPNPNSQYQYTTNAHFVRAGLNYRFGGGPAAAYAAYASAPAAIAYNWSGLYVGGVVGGGIVTPKYADPGYFNSSYYVAASDWAATGGATAGYNWQVGHTVLGIEADFNWTNYDHSVVNNASGGQLDTKWSWFSTVRARAGLAVDRTLIYATGGLAFVNLDYRAYVRPNGCGPAANTCALLRKTETGLATGAGLEHSWSGNWSFKAEYLFIHLPTRNIKDAIDPANPDIQYQYTTNAHFARFGVNYRWGGGPLVARY